jgi:hypothetical protein
MNVWRIPQSLQSASYGPVRLGRSIGMTTCFSRLFSVTSAPPRETNDPGLQESVRFVRFLGLLLIRSDE